MKIDPSSWILQAAKLQARVALVKSRDLHWTVASSASGDPKEMDLSTLTAIVVADGANPWSLSSCDQFVTTFESRGLRPDVLCPCAGSPETGTVSLRRYIFVVDIYHVKLGKSIRVPSTRWKFLVVFFLRRCSQNFFAYSTIVYCAFLPSVHGSNYRTLPSFPLKFHLVEVNETFLP